MWLGLFVLLPRMRAPPHAGGDRGEESAQPEQSEQREQREQREASEQRTKDAARARLQQTVHYHLNAALGEIEMAFQARRQISSLPILTDYYLRAVEHCEFV